MDEILERIVEFASTLSFAELPAAVVHGAEQRVIDSVGCAIGAQASTGAGRRHCAAAEVGLSVACGTTMGRLAGRVIGAAEPLAAESATFVNGCLIRDLDFNDTYPGHHPSDCLAAILAVAPTLGRSGQDLIAALVVSYEISIRLLKAGRLNRRGWDNGYATGIGTTAAVGRLLGSEQDQLRDAIAITATANVPMRATRAGQLSMWKGAATAYATRNAVFGALLAWAGMTGPEAPFTGRHGLFDLITGPLELDPFPTEGGEFLMLQSKLKYWPLVYNMQALVWAGIELRRQLDGRELVSADVLTYWSSWRESGSEPEKWDPVTRETADHSAPYILAYVLRHGAVGPEAFTPDQYLDPSIRTEMQRIRVRVDDEIEASYPETITMRVLATDVEGNHYALNTANPLGHESNPMSDGDIETKFRRLVQPTLGNVGCDAAVRCLWRLEDTSALHAMDLLVIQERDER